MTTPTPRSNREWRELAEQAQRDLAAALERAKSAGEDAFKLRVDLAAAQSELARARGARHPDEEAQAEIRSDLEAILDRMERGTTTKADAVMVAGYLGLGWRYESDGPKCRQPEDEE